MPENNLQDLAQELVQGEKLEEKKIENLYRFVKEKIKYKITIVGDSEEILKCGYGSCTDKSLLFSELLNFIGVKNQYHVVLVNFSRLIPKIFLAIFLLFRLKLPFYFHIFNEVYSEGRWKRMDTSFDGELERYLRRKGFTPGEKGCSIPAEYIFKDLGSFGHLSHVFTAPFFLELFGRAPSYKKEVQVGLNFCNWFLCTKRKNKTKELAKKETIENILININKLKR